MPPSWTSRRGSPAPSRPETGGNVPAAPDLMAPPEGQGVYGARRPAPAPTCSLQKWILTTAAFMLGPQGRVHHCPRAGSTTTASWRRPPATTPFWPTSPYAGKGPRVADPFPSCAAVCEPSSDRTTVLEPVVSSADPTTPSRSRCGRCRGTGRRWQSTCPRPADRRRHPSRRLCPMWCQDPSGRAGPRQTRFP